MSTRPAPAAMVAPPAVSVPARAKAGTEVRLWASGFQAGSQVQIVLDAPKRVVGSAWAQPDGTFRTRIVVPRLTSAGAHQLRLVGVASSGRPLALAAPVLIFTQDARAGARTPGDSLAEPVLLTLSAGVPLATWLVLEVMGWRARRLDRRPLPRH